MTSHTSDVITLIISGAAILISVVSMYLTWRWQWRNRR